jgi:hypothetical protein
VLGRTNGGLQPSQRCLAYKSICFNILRLLKSCRSGFYFIFATPPPHHYIQPHQIYLVFGGSGNDMGETNPSNKASRKQNIKEKKNQLKTLYNHSAGKLKKTRK